jgi:hypothetical protein
MPIPRHPSDYKANQRPTFRLLLRPEPGVDGERALRALLKLGLRKFRLKCIAVEQEPPR